MADDTTQHYDDLERLLSSYGDAIRFPATPDVAGAVERRLRVGQGVQGAQPVAADETPLEATSLSRPGPFSPVPFGIPDRQSRLRQFVGLAAGILIFAVVAGLLALIFRGMVPDSENAPAGFTFTPDTSYGLYISAGPENQDHLLPLDPWTLADRRDIPATGNADFPGTLSADGSTRVEIEYAEESSDGTNLPADAVTIIVSDGLTGAERARFHPPAHVVFPHLSADGTRLAVQHRQGYEEAAPPTWYLLDTSDGSLIGTVSWERDDLPGNRVLFSPDATRLYKASWRTVGALGPYHPEVGSLSITSYDLTTGEELERREYTDIPAGGWALDPEAAEDSDIASYEPGIALSPDGSRIAIVHADSEILTLVDAADLEETRTISLDEPASRLDSLLTWAGIIPTGAAAKGADLSERREAVFSPDGRYLYVWGLTSELDGGQPLYKGIGLRSIDLERGDVAAGILEDKQIEFIQPAPDGDSLYVTWFEHGNTSPSSTLMFQRLDAGTLEVLAEREFEGYRRFVIDRTEEVMAVEQETADVLGPLRITTTVDGLGLSAELLDATTLESLPGYAPISFGHHYTHAFSPDGRTLAVVTWPSGSSNAGGKLMLIDLTTWSVTNTGLTFDDHTGDLVYSPDGRALYWTLPTTTHPAHNMPRDFELYRFDLDTSSRETVASFPSSFSPSELRIFRAGTRLAIWGSSVDPNNIVDGPPRVYIVDLDADEIAAEIEIPNVKAWQHREDDGGTLSARIYRPGLAWDLDRELLYIAHAGEERITVVDLNAGVVMIQSDIVQTRSMLDQLIDWFAPTAAAKSTPWTSTQAVLSADGSRLYIAGRHETVTETEDGELARAGATDLLIVDTERFEEVERLDLGAVVGMQATPDGRHLLVRSYENVTETIGHRLAKLDMASGEIVAQVDLPELPANGFLVVGSQVVVRVPAGTGDAFHTDELRIDLETLTVLSRTELEYRWGNEILTPE